METVRAYENLASEYFQIALQALLDCGEPGEAIKFNANLRHAILYGAFAAEAYVNAYIDLACPDQARSMDRVSTLERLLLATRLTTGRNVFNRGGEPFQGLSKLFSRRNELVHHKPGFVKREFKMVRGLKPFDSPIEVTRFILAVAEATSILDECLDEIGIESDMAIAWDLGDEIDVTQRELDAWFVGEPVLIALEETKYLKRLAEFLDAGPPAQGTPSPRKLLGN